MITAKRATPTGLTRHPAVALTEIFPVPDKIRRFPSTRYCGSKRQLLNWIFENIKGLKFTTVLDGFGGTGSVSLLFKAMGKELTYHDAFSFNMHVAKTVLADELTVSREAFSTFINQTVPHKGLIYRIFKGLYYLDSENCWLDGFAKQLFSSDLNHNQKSLYLYTLFQACLKKRPFNLFHRTNLNLRLNKEVIRKFGNSVTWERSFQELMLQSYDEIATCVWKGRRKVKILHPSNVSTIRSGYDLVYLDPPYISLIDRYNRDDYWRKYHFLEGLSQYNEWQNRLDQTSYLKALPAPKSFNNWSNKASFEKHLCQLINRHRHSIVILSYLSNSYPDVMRIRNVFESLFPQVSVHSREHTHALSKNKKRELLFIGRP